MTMKNPISKPNIGGGTGSDTDNDISNLSKKRMASGRVAEEESKSLVNGSTSGSRGVEITITPVPSVPESLEERGGLELQTPTNWQSLVLKVSAILALLYLFVCSLGFLSDSFRLIAGKAAGEVLQKEKLIKNPVVGVMMGILVTVAVQSSSTSTSIVVSMVASGLFTVRTAIPIIMGANIGTSVTNTVVALTHMTIREDFERAFGGAVLHDMFNLLTVTTLLIVEKLTSYLEITTTKIVDMLDLQTAKGGEIQVLSVITKPFTSLIVQINKEVIIGWSINDPKYDNARLLKVWCNSTVNPASTLNSLNTNGDNINMNISSSNGHSANVGDSIGANASGHNIHGENQALHNGSDGSEAGVGSANAALKCKFLFNLVNWGDITVGAVLLAISLILLCGCLILIVKVLSSLLKGKLAVAVQKAVNSNIPYVPCLTGYLAIGIGAIMTIMVQSSSVFTSAMTPLIAMGMISLERAYPLTLGSNLGTTTTAMLAALATEGPNLRPSIQLALCHFLFNLTGILLFYPIPCTRFPIRMAAALGRITAKYRWFAVFYLISMFALLPLIVFSLTLLGPVAFYCVAGPVGIILGVVLLLNFLQTWLPQILPEVLTDWNFLPKWLNSLEPYDRIVDKLSIFFKVYCPICCGGVTNVNNSGTGFGGIITGGMRENRSSQVCFVNGSRSPSPQGNVFDNSGFTRNDNSFINLRMTPV